MSQTPRAEYEVALRAKLGPDLLRNNLARAGLVLATHEALKAAIVERVRGLFTWPDRSGQMVVDPEYDLHVTALDRTSRFRASCRWLISMSAMTEQDIALLERFRDHRHEVAHELVAYLIDPVKNIDLTLVTEASEVLRRVGCFWARINMDSDPDCDHREIDDDQIQPGMSLVID